MIFLIALTSLLCCLTSAETVHRWNFTTGWVTANPDGLQERKVIGWNGQWPLPLLEATIGDRIELSLTNGFKDLNTTLHFHGMFLTDNNQMDGPEMVVQCPIPPGETMLYNFTLIQTGAYWYHSHTKDQLIDGMRGPFIIHEKKDEFPYDFDEEVTLTVSDWYHDLASELRESFLSRFNPTGAEPIVKTILFNESHSGQWKVERGKTYLLNLINTGAFVSQYVYMEDHSFKVVAVDGVYVKPNVTDMLYITVAQRYTVLVETKNDTSRNYAFMQKQDDTMLDVPEDTLWLNATNYIVYDDSKAMPDEYMVDSLDILDDFYLRLILIEDPLAIQERQSLTDNYLDMCEKSGVKTSGNGAGNSEDFLDMTGENVQVKPLPDGFTARGIVALVFSFVSGILGCAAIGYYGMADIPDVEERTAIGLGLNDLAEDIEEEEEQELGETSRLNSSEHMRNS